MLAEALVGAQRVDVTSGPVPGHHQLRDRPLAEWVGLLEAVQLAEARRVLASPQQRVEALLGGADAQLIEPGDGLDGEVMVCELLERAPPPQLESATERRRRRRRVTHRLPATLVDEPAARHASTQPGSTVST